MNSVSLMAKGLFRLSTSWLGFGYLNFLKNWSSCQSYKCKVVQSALMKLLTNNARSVVISHVHSCY